VFKRPDSIMAHLPLLLLILPALLPSPTASVGIDFALHRCEPIAVEACRASATTPPQRCTIWAGPRRAERRRVLRTWRFLLCSVLTPMLRSEVAEAHRACAALPARAQPLLPGAGRLRLRVARLPQPIPAEQRPWRRHVHGQPGGRTPAGEPVRTARQRRGSRGGSGGRACRRLAAEPWRSGCTRCALNRSGRDCGHMRNREYVYINQTADCLLRCGAHDLFSQTTRAADAWWRLATLCALSSLLTIATFLMDRSRFQIPGQAGAVHGALLPGYSLSYFVRLAGGREAPPATGTSSAAAHMAASTWYVMLVFTWLLQAGWNGARKPWQGSPATSPASLGCARLPDRLRPHRAQGRGRRTISAMCNVGNQNSHTLLSFVIVPNVVFLALEVIFLLAGFVAMARVRRHVKSDGQKTTKFEMLMADRPVLGAVRRAMPASRPSTFYDYSSRDLWHVPGSPTGRAWPSSSSSVFASLVIGVTTILWIWSAKTLQTLAPTLLAPCRRRRRRRLRRPNGAATEAPPASAAASEHLVQ
uniref:Frizzled domain-containing protein n=1 Tax=Macrostomum lignano TaxID=282301 RepID=A0A1I8FQR2_9PLAT